MKYDCKFTIVDLRSPDESPIFHNWNMTDHKGKLVAMGCGYANWHNAKRAMDRHIKVIQSAQFTLPPKPLRKEYTFKAKNHASLQASTSG